MMHKVGRIASRLTSIISSWPEVDSVLSCEAAETDVLDPYFALVLDVYYDGSIPGRDERQTLYENPGAFETSSSGEKDRFFLEGLPVRVEFKSVRSIDSLIKNQFDSMLLFGSSGDVHPVPPRQRERPVQAKRPGGAHTGIAESQPGRILVPPP